MDNRRLLIAALLSVLLLIIWNQLFPTAAPPPPPAQKQAGREGSAPPAAPATEGPALSPEAATAGAEPAAERATMPRLELGGEEVRGESEERITLENERVRAEFSSLGAQLVSLQLNFHQSEEGKPLELVRARGKDPYPLAIVVDGQISHPLNSALFQWEKTTTENGQPSVCFRHRSEVGAARKCIRMMPEGFLAIAVETEEPRPWGLVFGPGLRNPTLDENDSRWNLRMVAYRRGDSTETLEPKSHDEELFLPPQGLRWVALEDNFFLAAVVPVTGLAGVLVRPVDQRPEAVAGEPRFLPAGAGSENVSREQLVLLQAAGPELAVETFFGAKQYSRLASLPYGLEETVRWGMLGFLVRPLYHGLEWIYHRIVANYGWAIVLITLVIKLLFFPLTHKSQKSMTKMQELNPKVQAIRTKYRSKLKDRQGKPNLEAQRQMNEEVMGVYRSSGVNPASGCLPILLQMPVFFALYKLLATAVELRHAPWIGWIHDLSVPDPYYLLPLTMGATSLLMQRMMPAPPDPIQRRLMQFMPIMFTAFAFAFPSGLVLYWLTNNVLTIGQQAILLRQKKQEAAKA